MKAIVTLVLEDMKKGMPKQLGLDVFGRVSTDIYSRHKSFLIEGDKLKDIEKSVLATMPEKARISRIEVIEDNEVVE